MTKTASKPTAKSICDQLRKQAESKRPGFAVCRLPPDQYAIIDEVVKDRLAGKLEGVSLDAVTATLVASGIKVTLDQLSRFIRAKKAGRV